MNINVPEDLIDVIEQLIIYEDQKEEEYIDKLERLYIYDYDIDPPYHNDEEAEENWKIEIQL